MTKLFGSIIFILIILLLVSVFLKIIKKIDRNNQGDEQPEIAYHKNKYFLTDAEKNFFFTLKTIADRHNWLIFSKVRLLDLFFVPRHDRTSRARIIQKHVDFVLCEQNNIDPICAIELDDSSHNNKNRIERDNFVNQVFKSASLPLVRIKNSYNYDSQKIEAEIVTAIQ